jgi:hypothetical protein
VEKNFKIDYQNLDSQIYGIELVAGSYKLEWNISDYIKSMEETMSESLEEKIKSKEIEGIMQNAV